MNLNINGYNIFTIVITTFIISVILVPIVKNIAFHVKAIDKPGEKRKIHKKTTPRMGGLAIFLAFLAGYIFYAPASSQMLSIIIGGFIIVLTGIIDDINPLKARYKLVSQVLAASVAVFYGGLVLTDFTVFGFLFEFIAPVNYIFSIFLIVGIMNAINLIDGLDGLAAGVSSIYFLTIGIIAVILNRLAGLDIILTFIMLGATLGFLVYNFHPASIFMGDTGSLFLGFIISIIFLLGFRTATVTSLIVPFVILAVPIFDTIFAIIRRLIKGESIAKADNEHLHHQFLHMKFSQRKTVLIIYVVNILFATISIFYILKHTRIFILIYAVLMIILIFFILKTNILFDKKTGKEK